MDRKECGFQLYRDKPRIVPNHNGPRKGLMADGTNHVRLASGSEIARIWKSTSFSVQTISHSAKMCAHNGLISHDIAELWRLESGSITALDKVFLPHLPGMQSVVGEWCELSGKACP